MPKRTICIQNPARLSVRNGLLLIEQDQRSATIPLEDIWVLILETHQARISTSALSAMVDNGIGVMMCGDDHMPNGLLLPIGAHSRHAAIVEDQFAISKPLKKRLWQQMVIAKIRNQAAVADLLGRDGKSVLRFAAEVQSGDVTNREAAAASAYFRTAIPYGTRRDGPYAASFDYGDGVLRAGIGREAVGGGWLVSRGIHHDNNLNAFNLVDDLIEPFRPVVDLIVLTNDIRDDLTKDKKAILASVFEYLVQMPDGKMPVQAAITDVFHSLREAVLDNDYTKLRLPEVIALQKGRFE